MCETSSTHRKATHFDCIVGMILHARLTVQWVSQFQFELEWDKIYNTLQRRLPCTWQCKHSCIMPAADAWNVVVWCISLVFLSWTHLRRCLTDSVRITIRIFMWMLQATGKPQHKFCIIANESHTRVCFLISHLDSFSFCSAQHYTTSQKGEQPISCWRGAPSITLRLSLETLGKTEYCFKRRVC